MRTLLAATLLAAATLSHAQSIEADLDGNASALQASEMRPAAKVASQPKAKKAERERIASR